MIKIIKGQANTVSVTLHEQTTLSPVRYLFEFFSKNTLKSTYCLVTELSPSLERYNEFVITEKNSPNNANNEVSLREGDYIYKAYELTTAQVSSLNFNNIVTTSYPKVEEMRCIVYGAGTSPYTSYEHSETNTVYER